MKREPKSSSKNIVEFAKDIRAHPIMIAYSGFVNDEIRKQGKDSGFQIVIEAPLSQQKITELIIPLLE